MTNATNNSVRFHFAGINSRDLAAHTKGQDVLVSFADLRSPGCWAWMQPLLEGGHFRTVVLDSGAFTIYAHQQRELAKGKTQEQVEASAPTITVEDFTAFASANAHLFTWIANMDDIGGNIEVSNANFATLEAAGLSGKVVPVWHEGESDAQLANVLVQAEAAGRVAVGMQRPKGSLVPSNVVACLTDVMPKIRALAPHIAIHGFGLTRYASPDTCPCGGSGWAFDSVDSTTWIAEGCAVERSGAVGEATDKATRILNRAVALRATVDSYQGIEFLGGRTSAPQHGELIDLNTALAAGGQAKTVAARLARLWS